MVLVGRPERRRPLERPWCKWKNNVKKDLKKVVWGVDWIDLAQDGNRLRAV
jgi:hypothetical protein